MRIGRLILVFCCLFSVPVCWSDKEVAKQPTGPARKAHINPTQTDPVQELARLRSEAIAHYESGIGQKTALEIFNRIVTMYPASSHDYFNLGLGYFKANDAAKAKAAFNKAIEMDSRLPQPHYLMGLMAFNSGKESMEAALNSFIIAKDLAPAAPSARYQLSRVYRELGKMDLALQEIVSTLGLDPHHTGALYQLYLFHQNSGDKTKADEIFKEFSRLKKASGTSRKENNPDEAELAQPLSITGISARALFLPETSPPHFEKEIDVSSVEIQRYVWLDRDPKRIGLVILDKDGVLRILKSRSGELEFDEVSRVEIGIPNASDLVTTVVSRGGDPSIFVAGPSGILHIFNAEADIGKASLKRDGAAKSETKSAYTFKQISKYNAVKLNVFDIDHDGDVDIIGDAFSTVLLNSGTGEFVESQAYKSEVSGIPLNSLSPVLAPSDLRNKIVTDLIVFDKSGNRIVLSDEMGGRYAAQQRALLPVSGASWLAIADLNNDGWTDVLTGSTDGVTVDYNEGSFRFRQVDYAGFGKRGQIIDFNNDGYKDVLLESPDGSRLMMNRGGDMFELSSPITSSKLRDLSSVDLNDDGVNDILGLNSLNKLVVAINRTKVSNSSIGIRLEGVRSAPDGRQTQVEIRYGSFYSKYESDGQWMSIPTPRASHAEIMRISWPNGFVENKFKVDADQTWEFIESERISGSCPSVYAYDGEQFHYVTDAFISGPMGVPMAPGRYFPVGNDEYVKIPGDLLLPDADGRLKVSIVEELREVTYIDQAKLVAVDYPEGQEAFPNEYLLPDKFPEFHIHLTSRDAHAVRAIDHTGVDVSELVATTDYRYPANFSRSKFTGFASPNGVELKLTNDQMFSSDLRLFLTGWFYYFDSTSLMAASQDPTHKFIWPQVQVKRNGQWETLVLIGIPSGKGKTVVVDLGNGIVPEDATAIRIWSNVELYWDRILVDTNPVEHGDAVELHEAKLWNSRLGFHGFSELIRPTNGFPMPDRFNYHRVTYQSMWNPLSGIYTRYGDVSDLTSIPDSKMVVFGSGDELMLTFATDGLPPVQPGYKRDYLLYLNGYVKDGDKYTAYPGSTEPVPFHGLSQYPYSRDEWTKLGPKGEDYLEYLKEYQTRAPLIFDGVEPPAPVLEHNNWME